MLSEAVRKNLLQFCDRETDPRAFEAWVCGAQALEGEIGHGPYIDLVSADYQGRDIAGARERCESCWKSTIPGTSLAIACEGSFVRCSRTRRPSS
jgi:hypothetical protein